MKKTKIENTEAGRFGSVVIDYSIRTTGGDLFPLYVFVSDALEFRKKSRTFHILSTGRQTILRQMVLWAIPARI